MEGEIVTNAEFQKAVAEKLRTFSAAMQKFAKAGRKAGEAGRKFAEAIQHWNVFPPCRLPELLAYEFTGTDGAICEASRLKFSPDKDRWPATHN